VALVARDEIAAGNDGDVGERECSLSYQGTS